MKQTWFVIVANPQEQVALLGSASDRDGLRDLLLSSPLDLTDFTERITRINLLKQHLLIAGRGGSYYFQSGFPFITNSSYSK
jgi:hypothetical protein